MFLFRSSNFVSLEEFRIFAESIIRNQNYIQALEWVPKVPHVKRQKYEEKTRFDGLRSFQFSERSKEGKMIRVEMRELYYPVYYVHRIERNEAALGFDLFGNSTRRKILWGEICPTGQISRSEQPSAFWLARHSAAGPRSVVASTESF